jgi:outer membrane protein TolC
MSRRGMRRMVAVMFFLAGTVEICGSQAAPAGLLPQANLTAATALEQYNFQSVERLSKWRAAGPYQWIEAGPAFSQSVLNLPLIRNYQIGREGVRESRAQERGTREDITASVVLQYHLVLRAIAIRDAAKARVALAERRSNLAINQQKTGVGLLIDTTRAQVELQNERQTLIDAETEVHTTLYVLEELLDKSHGDRKEATENECYREESVAHRFAHAEYSIPVRARISGSRTIPTLIDACVGYSFPRG